MKIVIDMNLPPAWREVFESSGHTAVHWSQVGNHKASDAEIMKWARDNQHVVFTHDLDFSAVLALTHAHGPSVIQVRADDVMPASLSKVVVPALEQSLNALKAGALLVIEPWRSRIRLLPLRQ